MVAALTNESATSKSVYFAHCTSEMIFITHLLAEEPEKLAGPLLADTYVTLLKGRNAWYGQKLAKGELSLDMGDSIKGKGMIQVCHLTLKWFLRLWRIMNPIKERKGEYTLDSSSDCVPLAFYLPNNVFPIHCPCSILCAFLYNL